MKEVRRMDLLSEALVDEHLYYCDLLLTIEAAMIMGAVRIEFSMPRGFNN